MKLANVIIGVGAVMAAYVAVTQPVGRLPGGTALSSYGSSPQAVSPVPASIAIARGEVKMVNRQVDPDGPYVHGYRDAEAGLPLDGRYGNPYLNASQRRDYENGYRAAKSAEKSPL